MTHQNYFVYIVTNDDRHTVLYVGITNNVENRLSNHSLHLGGEFTRRNNTSKLIYFETFRDPTSAIAREKQLKGWTRAKKETLIAKVNREWRDLLLEMHATRPCGDNR